MLQRTEKKDCFTYSRIDSLIDAMKSILIRLLAGLIFSQPLYLLGAETEPYTLLVFGDSLSASYGMNEEDGWVTLLAERMQTENWPYQVINGSISGETTTGGGKVGY